MSFFSFCLDANLPGKSKDIRYIWNCQIIIIKVINNTLAIITGSWFETALNYKPQILGSKIEEFPYLVHELSVIATALQYEPQWKMR